MLLQLPYASREAKTINKLVYEQMYYSAVSESNLVAMRNTSTIVKTILERKTPFPQWMVDWAKRNCGAYTGFWQSPMANGEFHFDLFAKHFPLSDYGMRADDKDWHDLRERVRTYGVANSLFLAQMPTESVALLLGTTPSTTPFMSGIVRKGLSDTKFVLINDMVYNLMVKHNQWNDDTIDCILAEDGSLKSCKFLTEQEYDVYKTLYEIGMDDIVQMRLDRAPFIDQGESGSVYIDCENLTEVNESSTLNRYIWMAFNGGLKTAVYYTKTKSGDCFLSRKSLPQQQECESCA
jgi:ribonucleotide reductase alpha subunit